MKESSELRWIIAFVALCVFALGGGLISLIALPYEQTRNQAKEEYRQRLDAHVQSPDTKDLSQISAGLRQWLEGYKELEVSSSYSDAYKKVENILAEADALNKRMPAMSALAFQSELSSLRTKVRTVPEISEELYTQRVPWFSGFTSYVVQGMPKFVLCLIIATLFGFMWSR